MVFRNGRKAPCWARNFAECKLLRQRLKSQAADNENSKGDSYLRVCI